MGFGRVAIKLLSGAAFAIVMRAGVVGACEPLAWHSAGDPALSCLRLTQEGESSFYLHNDCAEPVEITPEECDEPCSETVLVAPNATKRLVLREPVAQEDREVFDYQTSEQSGALEFTFKYLPPCENYDESGGCSAASAGGRFAVPQAGMWIVFLVFLGCQRRRC